MNGDLSRVTFNPLKHFTSIVWQQGRVQMDADGNEQTAILLHHLRSLAADLIGPHGGPDDVFDADGITQRNCGFGIVAAAAVGETFFPTNGLLNEEKPVVLDARAHGKTPIFITPGHYYVDGLLCESENLSVYREQPYLEHVDDAEIKKLSGLFLLYIDVWERFVTAADDPSIREVALGGADTAARNKLIWQVKVRPLNANALPTCADFTNTGWPAVLTQLRPANRGKLRAMAKDRNEDGDEDVCITSPEARFRGLENQLYRVEIHRGGKGMNSTGTGVTAEEAATIKWSRDNGTTVVPVKEKIGERLIVSGLRDLSRWFDAGNWVEITHDALELSGRPGTLVRLAKVEGEVLTLDPYTTSGTIYDPESKFEGLEIRNLKVRRWDQKQPEDDLLQDGAIPIVEGEEVWIDLEDGVRIQFGLGPPDATYLPGDYWLIPARVATGDVEWPQETLIDPEDLTRPKAMPPNGVDHHYAPLAAVTLTAGSVDAIVDLRHKFVPLAVCR